MTKTVWFPCTLDVFAAAPGRGLFKTSNSLDPAKVEEVRYLFGKKI